MKAIIVLLLAGLTYAQNLAFDCSRIPETCKNMCYGVNCRNLPTRMTFDDPSAATKKQRRDDAGCTKPNRCNGRTDGMTTCDEFPFASSQEGGGNAVTRCVSQAECWSQGGSLSGFYRGLRNNQQSRFTISFTNEGNIPWCVGPGYGGCTNDGEEYQHGAPARRRDLSGIFTESARRPGKHYRTKGGLKLYVPSGDAEIGGGVFVPNATLISRNLLFERDDDCNDGVDETRKRSMEELSMEELGEWDEIESVITN